MLTIRTTSLDDYAPGGVARLHIMVAGGPGVGKTRWSSFWPRPFYANVEKRLAAIADRRVPYADINRTDDMLALLKVMKAECAKPQQDRRWDTLVIDTLDAWQRLVMDEWVVANRAERFNGYDAWGFLDAQMNMLMTRLLNLDMHVIVLVHVQDKLIKDDDNTRLLHELQLRGSWADIVLNDFDLVGLMDTYWSPNPEGPPIEKRGLTFRRTPEWPILKDNLNLTEGKWIEVDFSPDDYTRLFDRLHARLGKMEEEGVPVTSEAQELEVPGEVEGVVDPGNVITDLQGGPVPEQAKRKMSLDQLTKAELMAIAKRVGLTFKTNALKAEIVAELQLHRVNHPEWWDEDGSVREAPQDTAPAGDAQPESGSSAPEQPAAQVEGQAEQTEGKAEAQSESKPSTAVQDDAADAPAEEAAEALEPEPEPQSEAPASESQLESEPVASAPAEADAPGAAAESAGGSSSDEIDRSDPDACSTEGCDPALPDSPEQYVQLAYIKYRRRMCLECFEQARKDGQPPAGCGWSGRFLTVS